MQLDMSDRKHSRLSDSPPPPRANSEMAPVLHSSDSTLLGPAPPARAVSALALTSPANEKIVPDSSSPPTPHASPSLKLSQRSTSTAKKEKSKEKKDKKEKKSTPTPSPQKSAPAAPPPASYSHTSYHHTPVKSYPERVGAHSEHLRRLRTMNQPLVSPEQEVLDGYPDLGYLAGPVSEAHPSVAAYSKSQILSPSGGAEIPPEAAANIIAAFSPPGLRDATRSPERSLSPFRARYSSSPESAGRYAVQHSASPTYIPQSGSPYLRHNKPSVIGGPIGGSSHAPPPGMTEVFVVEWAPNIEPQMLEIQRGGAGIAACAVFHLSGIRSKVVAADDITDVAVGGGMWISVRSADGSTQKLRPRSAADFGLLVESLGSLHTIGANANPSRQVRAAPLDASPSVPRVNSGGSGVSMMAALKMGFLMALISCVGYFVWTELVSGFFDPVLCITYISQQGSELNDVEEAAALKELFRGEVGGGGSVGEALGTAFSCCRVRDDSEDASCSLVIVDCGEKKACKYHTEALNQLKSNTVKVVGVIGAAADEAEGDPYLAQVGTVVGLNVKQGALTLSSRAALHVLLKEKCPRTFSLV